MFTRCANCKTVFRVTPQQLQASSGQVRCGRCESVFDAFASLSAKFPSAVEDDEDDDVAGQPAGLGNVAAALSRSFPSPERANGEERTRAKAVVQIARPEPAPPRSPDIAAGASRILDEAIALDSRDRLEDLRVMAAPAAEAPLDMPAEVIGVPPRSDVLGRRLRIASIALGVIAFIQALWVFATPIANAVPGLRPAMEGVCTVLFCSVALPRLPDQLFLEASDLQMVTPARPNEVLLTATFRNRADVAQQLPQVELTLIAGANQTAARKVFRPEEYLGPQTIANRGIAANQEVQIRLYLNTGKILPSGYRLFIFFT